MTATAQVEENAAVAKKPEQPEQPGDKPRKGRNWKRKTDGVQRRMLVKLPPELRGPLEQLAKQNDRSITAEVSRAVRAALAAAGIPCPTPGE